MPKPSRGDCAKELDKVMAYTDPTLEGRWLMSDPEKHAIVHILRHRRQIERFLSEPQFRPKDPSRA